MNQCVVGIEYVGYHDLGNYASIMWLCYMDQCRFFVMMISWWWIYRDNYVFDSGWCMDVLFNNAICGDM